MAASNPEQSVAKDADRIITAYNTGVSVECVFDGMSRKQQIDVYKELNRRHEIQPDDPSIPNFVLSFDNSGAHLLRKDGKPDNDKSCVAEAKEKTPPLQRVSVSDTKIAPSYPSERYAHPERDAARLEDTALQALRGDEQARLDLRVEMANLMGMPKDYRERVIAKMKDDGSYGITNLTSDRPHVVVSTDPAGNPIIEFSKRLGIDKQTIPLNQNIDQQVNEAQRNYVNALRSVTGGLGKFDPGSTLKAMDILDGAEPTNLRWFMLYRKQQGRPAVDLAENN
ncbi:MAG: hypothetical protein IT342_13700 [Candidatus Melainabacteria bacterium]|nr:hypothetical protein [Candidatus Melainabacteria bacterium]